MKILLTGSTGMVGSNILEHPFTRNHKLLHPRSTALDLRDYEMTKAYIKKEEPDLIIHAAGLVGGIQANINNPIGFMIDNLDMGRNVVLAAKESGVQKFLNIASSCMYPKEGENPLKEETILTGPLEPTNEGYAFAKIMVTKLCQYISETSKDLRYKTIIPCNLYGRHDKFSLEFSHMIPAVIRKIHEAKEKEANEVVIWGDGQSRREFMYAADLADFIGYAINNFKKMPQNINVGIGRDWTIEEYYRIIAKVIGYEGRFTHDLTKPSGMRQKLVDDSKLRKFGWAPSTSIEIGIKKTYEYFKKTIK
ncbi:GDP-L-fucose synthase [Muricauda sp. SCSIO 64092]|uniref:GDP-L-fucose synthase family protein n=1 Tax=Allomuricauda sp. SCSIO 64092 TaxID=2908842 RepID=UPI001FF3EE97|nr:GDP-L-fucose synthase [Muricauda sp. SCSIO 64092]UOY08837.1 GDP-L-fucose synthase [Muricauda sp. SCSIO 64092]